MIGKLNIIVYQEWKLLQRNISVPQLPLQDQFSNMKKMINDQAHWFSGYNPECSIKLLWTIIHNNNSLYRQIYVILQCFSLVDDDIYKCFYVTICSNAATKQSQRCWYCVASGGRINKWRYSTHNECINIKLNYDLY